MEAPLAEAEVVHQRAADVADADEHGLIAAIHAEYACDLVAESRNVIAIALLSELTEAAEILTYL